MYYYGFDITYLIFVVPALLLGLFAQAKMQSAFSKYSRVYSRRGVTADQVARGILSNHGLHGVTIEHVSGNLSDHYDPRTNTVRLSDSVYGSSSIAAIGVAAHEVGHAIQHAEHYAPLKLRNAIIPVTQIGSSLSMPLILVGLLLNTPLLAYIGIALFAGVALFQLITLPVEYNASRRAVAILGEWDILDQQELGGTRKVLNAAALTYVAALLTSLAQILRLLVLVGGNSRRRN